MSEVRTPVRTWTPERRQRQREAIQRWKPWQQATGPRSAAGKAVSAGNAYKGGHTVKLRRLIVELNGLLREQGQLMTGEWLPTSFADT